jgi:hypothetical protein
MANRMVDRPIVDQNCCIGVSAGSRFEDVLMF